MGWYFLTIAHKFGVMRFGQRAGHPGAQPDQFQMGNRPERLEDRSIRWSGSSNGSPPERITSRTSVCSRK